MKCRSATLGDAPPPGVLGHPRRQPSSWHCYAVLDYSGGSPKRIDIGFIPAPSGPQMHFWQDEEEHSCFIIMTGYAPDMESPDRVETEALISGVGCVQSVFGYPNEEAFWKDPRGDFRHGCFEIDGSKWHENIDAYNLRSFGNHYWRDNSPALHHYFVGSKDASCQFLARSLEVELFPGKSRGDIIRTVYGRQREQFTETLRRIREMQQHSQPSE